MVAKTFAVLFGMSSADMSVDDEGSLLSLRKAHLELDDDMSELNAYCNAVFSHSAPAAHVCAGCVSTVKQGMLTINPNADISLDYSRAPGFVTAVAGCLLPQLLQAVGGDADALVQAFPDPFKGKIQACKDNFGLQQCATAAAHCGAVHYPSATASCTAGTSLECIVEDHGFLSCMAHRLDSTCVHSAMGAGKCLAAGLECVDAGVASGTQAMADCVQQKHVDYFTAHPAEKSAADMCLQYYGEFVCMDSCLGCAAEAIAESGAQCEGEHCLRVPGFVQGAVVCMLEKTGKLPLPFEQVQGSCAMAYPEDAQKTGLCKASATQCLALQPCTSMETCAASDGWAACFAKKMDINDCNYHHAGMASCVACGHHCLSQDNGCAVHADDFKDEAACVACHQQCTSGR